MADHERHYEPHAERIQVEELGETECCGGRRFATEVATEGVGTQRTNHAEHAEDCKLENPASAKNPVNPNTRKREKAKAAKAGN